MLDPKDYVAKKSGYVKKKTEETMNVVLDFMRTPKDKVCSTRDVDEYIAAKNYNGADLMRRGLHVLKRLQEEGKVEDVTLEGGPPRAMKYWKAAPDAEAKENGILKAKLAVIIDKLAELLDALP